MDSDNPANLDNPSTNLDSDGPSNLDEPGTNMEPDNPANLDDHGMNMDSDNPANLDDPGRNMDLLGLGDNNDHGSNSDQGRSNADDPVASTSSQSDSSTTAINIRCINCGLNVSQMRRHPLILLEVRSLVQRWVASRQVQVSSDNCVCHACWTIAWNEILRPGQQQSTTGHRQVCIGCGRSLLRTRSHLLRTDTARERQIWDLIAQQIAPSQVPNPAHICHPCWQRNDRARRHNNSESSVEDSETASLLVPQTGTLGSDTIFLPSYTRAASTQARCFFPGCTNSQRLAVPSALRAVLFCDYNYYVPPDCRICHFHLRNNSWDLLSEYIETPNQTFTATHIEEFATLLKENMYIHLDFENMDSIPDHMVHYYVGFTKQQFAQILSEVPRLSNKHRGALALAAYLIKLRTGDSDERLSSLLQLPRSTLERLMKIAREILNQDFVPRNLGLNHITREEIAERNLLIPNGLFGGPERNPIIIADGTYVYIEKSSNYLYQKNTYSLHKYRNLVKPFLFVCTDGYIIDVLGPYPATTSDANIMLEAFSNENSPCRQFFQENDVFILDRGFRDSLQLLRNCNYSVHVPLSPEDGESQLTTLDANKSRCVTMCRWVVEAVNGIFKKSFKIFKQNYFNLASTHLMIDFSVAASLINKFHVRYRDRDDAAQILEIVQEKMNVNNDLSDFVRQRNLNRARADFVNINVSTENVTQFPRLTISDLILIACGTYQIKQARSYYGEHIRFNGCYRIEVCRDRRNSIMHYDNDSLLLRAKIQSRHISRRTYFVYILINSSAVGREAIKQYCCNCIVGRRTVGCCAHVMSVLWYLGWGRHESYLAPPAQFLDNVLIEFDDIDDENII